MSDGNSDLGGYKPPDKEYIRKQLEARRSTRTNRAARRSYLSGLHTPYWEAPESAQAHSQQTSPTAIVPMSRRSSQHATRSVQRTADAGQQRPNVLEVPGSRAHVKIIPVREEDPPGTCQRHGLVKIALQRDGWLVAVDWDDGERIYQARGIAEERDALAIATITAFRIGPSWLVDANASWRSLPATPSAIRYAQSQGITPEANATAGTVSNAINLKRACATAAEGKT